jgi:glucose dehydrogenase
MHVARGVVCSVALVVMSVVTGCGGDDDHRLESRRSEGAQPRPTADLVTWPRTMASGSWRPRTTQSTRFSGLTQIDTGNVARAAARLELLDGRAARP